MPPRTPGNLNEMGASLRSQWQAFQPGQRRTVIALGVLALAGIVVWASLTARGPAMAPLFTNLAPADGAAIVTVLDRIKVPYKLADNGQTILVPAAQVDRVRLQLAGQGLPNHGTVGLSSVLNLPFGATDFTRQVAYQNGLQGELEQTIDQIAGVSSSAVQVVLPQTPTFGGQGTPASAAVLVNLQPGVTLNQNQVGGIVHLVASSVQGLSPANVTVVDQTGQILWSQGAATATGGDVASGIAGQAQNNLQVEQQVDQQLQQSLQQLLAQVFGPGNVITQVNAQLNFNSGTQDQTLFQPAGSSPAVVQSMQELKQTVVGGQASGVTPGTAANSFPTYASNGTAGSTSSTSDQLTQNFDVSQQTQHTVIAPGAISRLSVAVVVNATLTPAQQALVKSTVQAAVGADSTRQDQITVVGMPFNHALLNNLSKQPSPAARAGVPLPLAAGAGAVLLLLLVGALVMRRRPAAPEVEELGGGGPGDAALVTNLARDAMKEPVDDPLGLALASAQTQRDRMQAALGQRPEDVARVIRVWLAQDD